MLPVVIWHSGSGEISSTEDRDNAEEDETHPNLSPVAGKMDYK